MAVRVTLSEVLKVRLDTLLLRNLEAEAERRERPASALARTYIREGLARDMKARTRRENV